MMLRAAPQSTEARSEAAPRASRAGVGGQSADWAEGLGVGTPWTGRGGPSGALPVCPLPRDRLGMPRGSAPAGSSETFEGQELSHYLRVTWLLGKIRINAHCKLNTAFPPLRKILNAGRGADQLRKLQVFCSKNAFVAN